MTSRPESFQELISQMRTKLPDTSTRELLNRFENLFFDRELAHDKQKQIDQEEIEVLRGLVGTTPGDIKFRFATQQKEISKLTREVKETRNSMKTLSDKNIELENESVHLQEENKRLKFTSAKEKGEWDWSADNWEKERQMLLSEVAKMETKFKQMAQELIHATTSVHQSSQKEKDEMEERLNLQMVEVLNQQKHHGLHEERMLLQGLYSFLTNQIGGIAGSIQLLKERASSLTPPVEATGSYFGSLMSLPKRMKHLTTVQAKLGSEIKLLEETLEQNSVSLQKLQKGLNEFAPIIKMREPQGEKLFLTLLLDKTIGGLEELFKSNNIKILKHWKEIPPVWADKEMIQSALVEILTNAADAQPKGGEIDISVEEVDQSLVSVLILDRGPGIPRHLVEKIFQAFFTTKKNHSGLGLTHTLRWFSLNGGYVETRSDAGRGEFVLKLPIHK